MADEQHELRHVNWNEVFDFTHIFKSFRMAIHPSKLLLAVAAIVVVYLAGRVMDLVWSRLGQRAMPGEIGVYADSSASKFQQIKDGWDKQRNQRAAELVAATRNQAGTLSAYLIKLPSGRLKDAFLEELRKANQGKSFALTKVEDWSGRPWRESLAKAQEALADEVRQIGELLKEADKRASGAIKSLSRREERAAGEELEDHYAKALQALTARKAEFADEVEVVCGRGIFAALLAWEDTYVNSAIAAVWRGDIGGGLAATTLARERGGEGLRLLAGEGGRGGFVYCALMAMKGIAWLLTEHWLYAIIFLAVSLAVWALAGGAIYRIAALHAAREEKISIVQALRFSLGKFFSFFTAPLIPLAIILVLGLLMALGGLLGNLWGFGAILIGVLFFLAILVGLLVAFLLRGLITGSGLMYPTIAVEGSDNFDAISRSYSYVFAKPWRTTLYGVVALFYGSLCYLFVYVFAYLALASTHYFVNWGIFGGGQRVAGAATKLDVMWAAPSFNMLRGPMNWAGMTGAEKVGAFFIALWVFLVIAAVWAFLLSYIASSTTVIYYLLRRKVDATDLDEVYVEERPEELPAPAAAPAEQPEAPAQGEQGEQGAQRPT
jgi:hypothetical protein